MILIVFPMTKKSQKHHETDQHIENFFLQEHYVRAEAQKFQETKCHETKYNEEEEPGKNPNRGKQKLLYSLTDSFEM